MHANFFPPLKKIKAIFGRHNISLTWVKRDRTSWLSRNLNTNFIESATTPYTKRIEKLANLTNKLGPQPLWDGYEKHNTRGPTRMPDVVRTASSIGNIYTHFVQILKPDVVVEFGTAFGISGMYFLAGLESNGKGKLLTFEPNNIWGAIANKNLAQISDKYHLTIGTFEDNIDRVLARNGCIDLAFIDAIHTKEFVSYQLDVVVANSCRNAIIILDDINFSDSMRECWQEVSADSRFCASVALGGRVGIVELTR